MQGNATHVLSRPGRGDLHRGDRESVALPGSICLSVPTWGTVSSVTVATSSKTTLVVPGVPAFVGRWRVDARNKGGGLVGSPQFSTAGVSHVQSGRPAVRGVPSTLTSCIGDSFTLRASEFDLVGCTYQWRRGGKPITGATAATFTAVMTADGPESGVYDCMVGNDCGSSVSAPIEVVRGAGAPAAVFNPTSHTEQDELTQTIVGTSCPRDFPTVVRTGFCNALYASVGESGMSVDIAAPQTSPQSRRIRKSVTSFTIDSPTRLQCLSEGIDAQGGAFNSNSFPFRVQLTGPVAFNDQWYGGPKSRDVVLTPGNYTMTVTVQNGGLCCGCIASTCGSTSTMLCSAEASAVSLAVDAQFTVRHPADLNGDWTVDGADLALLLANWGTSGGDVNGDGITNGDDPGILLAAWR